MNLKTVHPPDIRFSDYGSIWLLRAETQAGLSWIDEHIPDDAQRMGQSVIVEPRYIEGIVRGLIEDGLTASL